MSDFKVKQAVSTYFDLLCLEGIPEKFVKDEYLKDNRMHVVLLTGKEYSKSLNQPAYVQTRGDVSEWMVSGPEGSFT